MIFTTMATKLANRPRSVLLTFVRYRHNPKAWIPDAVKYPGVTYYPRNKTDVDPPIVPSKIFMIHRVKSFKGNPYWDKDTLKRIGLSEVNREPVFVKNTPEVCSQLWKIKHLIKITPVKLPDGEIKADENREYYFHSSGDIYIGGKLDPARLEATKNFKNSMARMERRTISEKLRLRWINGSLI
nr:39S ribosomal protein L30, mitochondrial [Megalopta genalis]